MERERAVSILTHRLDCLVDKTVKAEARHHQCAHYHLEIGALRCALQALGCDPHHLPGTHGFAHQEAS